jgi:hypothetical protein
MNLLESIKSINFEIKDGTSKSVQIKFSDDNYILFIDGIKWMNFNTVTKQEALEFLIHYHVAEGNVVTTGLGLGIREQLLLSKPEVKSLTIVEKSIDLINYHKEYSNWAKSPRVNFVNLNAGSFADTCDVLLLDHFENQNLIGILNNVYTLNNRIKPKIMWFWPFEFYIRSHMMKYNLNAYESYDRLKKQYNLQGFPSLSLDLLTTAVSVFPEVNSVELYNFV